MKRRRKSSRNDEPQPLKPLAFLLLVALAAGERHGYALKKEVAARTGGKVRPGPATLYRSLAKLLEQGLIEESDRRPAPELDDERRRYYRISQRGRGVVLAEARRLEGLVAAARTAVLEA
jgi:DNA-binding PadR family transcriptional regulator